MTALHGALGGDPGSPGATGSPGTTPIVRADDLVKHFPLGSSLPFVRGERKVVHAVDHVDLAVAAGEVVGLIGESGSGKSTLGRVLLRLHDPTAGRVFFDGEDITTVSGERLRQLRRRMSLVFQNPYAAVNRRRRVHEIVAQPLVAQGMGNAGQRAARVGELLDAVGVPALAHRFPSQLSGGQLQRVVVARALATDPDFIVADEPTASLDVSVRAQIVNLLADLRAEHGIAMLFISHDLRTVAHIADRVAVMYLGCLVEVGSARQVTRDPQHPYTRSLIAALPQLRGGRRQSVALARGEVPNPADPPSGCRYHTRCPLAEERCRRDVPALEMKASGRLAACHLLPVAPAEAAATSAAPAGARSSAP